MHVNVENEKKSITAGMFFFGLVCFKSFNQFITNKHGAQSIARDLFLQQLF